MRFYFIYVVSWQMCIYILYIHISAHLFLPYIYTLDKNGNIASYRLICLLYTNCFRVYVVACTTLALKEMQVCACKYICAVRNVLPCWASGAHWAAIWCEHVSLLWRLTLVILGCAQRLFPVVACIQVFSGGVHSCLREHFFSCTHQPHSNLGFAFRHIPQLSLRA